MAYLKPPWFTRTIFNRIAMATGVGGSETLTVTKRVSKQPQKIPVVVPEVSETTALGAAYLAGLATGYWSDRSEINAKWRLARRYTPSMDEGQRARLYKRWNMAVERAKNWAREETALEDAV